MNSVNDSPRHLAVFKDIVETYIKPLSYGAVLEGPHNAPARDMGQVSFDTIHRLRIYTPGPDRKYFLLKRLLPFTQEEKDFIEEIMQRICQQRLYESNAYHLLVSACIDQVIAFHLSPQHANTVYQVIEVYGQWAAETYEGKRISHATGLYLNKSAESDHSFFALRNCDFIKTLGSTSDVILTLDRQGGVIGLESISGNLPGYRKNQEVLAPFFMADLAIWTGSKDRVAVQLTRGGEILIFKNKRLVFAKRRSFWRSFPHQAILEAILAGSRTVEETEAKKAVYLTALDVAMSHRGACLGVFRDAGKRQRGLKSLSPEVVFSAERPARATSLLKSIINSRRFFEIPRNVRVDLCTIDGAIILDECGHILTAGAILKTAGNAASGGGRAAAAQALAKNGMGLKISSDGYIQMYLGNNPPLSFA